MRALGDEQIAALPVKTQKDIDLIKSFILFIIHEGIVLYYILYVISFKSE